MELDASALQVMKEIDVKVWIFLLFFYIEKEEIK